MRKASIDVKTKDGTRKMYRVEFKDLKHGDKIIEIRFDDGYSGIDGFKTNQNK